MIPEDQKMFLKTEELSKQKKTNNNIKAKFKIVKLVLSSAQNITLYPTII